MHESVDLLCYVCDVSACADRQLAIATTPLNQIILFIVTQEYPKYYIIYAYTNNYQAVHCSRSDNLRN